MTSCEKCLNCAAMDHTAYPFTAYPPPNIGTEFSTNEPNGTHKEPTLTKIGAGHINRGRIGLLSKPEGPPKKPTIISDEECSRLLKEGIERGTCKVDICTDTQTYTHETDMILYRIVSRHTTRSRFTLLYRPHTHTLPHTPQSHQDNH